MVRLLIEDVTLRKGEGVTVQVCFKGGTTHTLTLPAPLPATHLRRTARDVVDDIDRLLDDHTDVAETLKAICAHHHPAPRIAAA